MSSPTPSRSLALLGGAALLVVLLTGCVASRSAKKAIVDEVVLPGWDLVYDGPLAAVPGAGLVPVELAGYALKAWARVWEQGSSRLGLTVLYTGDPVPDRFAAARRLRRFFQGQRWEWTDTYDDVPGAVTREVSGEVWVHGGNQSFFFVIRPDDVPHEVVAAVFEQQMAALPEYNPFDSIRPGATFVLAAFTVAAAFYGAQVHRDRVRLLADARVEVFR